MPERRAARSHYICDDCNSKANRARYERRKEAGLPLGGIKYRYRPEYHREHQRKLEVRERRNAHQRAWYHNPANREKIVARYKSSNALARGRMSKLPCEVCGESRSEMHHDDYSKPLDVRWLCRKHHNEVHGKTRALSPKEAGR